MFKPSQIYRTTMRQLYVIYSVLITQITIWSGQSLTRAAVTEFCGKPRVDFKTLKHIKDESIVLVCSLEVVGTLECIIQWVLPNKQYAQNDTRMTVSSSSVPDPQRSRYVINQLQLIIHRAALTDTGAYQCEIVDHKNNTKQKQVQVVVMELGEPYINLYAENGSKFIKANTTKPSIAIAVRYLANPKPNFYWIKDSSEQTLDADEKYCVVDDGKTVTLIIKNTTVYDSGTYTLIANNGGNAENYSTKVDIRGKPILTMNTIYAKPNETVTFNCTAIGNPKPNIKFAFVPCRDEPWTNCSAPIPRNQMVEDGQRLFKSAKDDLMTASRQYTMQAHHAGYVECRAENALGYDMVMADLLVSDLEEPIVVYKESPESDVTFGDQVEIICAARVYNYKNNITFFRDDEVLNDNSRTGDISFNESYEKYAFRKKLIIHRAGKEHGGTIRCQVGVANSNQSESKTVELVISKPIAPVIVGGIALEEIVAEIGNSSMLTCTTKGMPKPTIEWFKSDEPMTFDEVSRVKLANDKVLIPFLRAEDSGTYTCRAKNKVSQIEKTWNINVKTVSKWIYLALSLLIVMAVVIAVILVFYIKNKKEVKSLKEAGLAYFKQGDLQQLNPEISLDEQADLLPYKSEYEFPSKKLKLGKQLGAGAFGVVIKATAQGIVVSEDETTVAVKMVKKQTDYEIIRALIIELKIMIHLGQHLNIVNLLGAVTKNIAKRQLMVIVEYCQFGNVQNFLLKHRPYFVDQINADTDEINSMIEKNEFALPNAGNRHNRCNEATVMSSVEGEVLNTATSITSNVPLLGFNYGMDYKHPTRSVTTIDLVCWASQVACGMEYLASRKVLHGDLAARNILLCDDNVVKICDFGLARSMHKSDNYKKKGEALLPFKWLALESISDNIFGSYSDVWAYGIMLWEFFSLAKAPYPGMEANQDLYSKLRDGYRMEKPQYANQDIYDIMLNCWKVKPDSRPLFKELKSRFNAMLPEEMRNHYIDLNEPYLAMNNEREQRGEPDYLASLGPPEEQAPPVPLNYVNGNIFSLHPIADKSNFLEPANTTSDSEMNNFDLALVNSSQLSPTLKHNLDTTSCSQQGLHPCKQRNFPEKFDSALGLKSHLKTDSTNSVPVVSASFPEHAYTNVKSIQI